MNGYENTYDKYLTENDQFVYDEQGKRSVFLKQDSELFLDESYVPGKCIRVKYVESDSGEDWHILIDEKEQLVLKGNRFSTLEREFFRSTKGVVFIIEGIKKGWKSVSEFKRHVKENVKEA
jgi:hypothetical protein